jgi:transposase
VRLIVTAQPPHRIEKKYLKAYLKYLCGHSLCNAHHRRELIWVIETGNQAWAQQMNELLLAIKAAVDDQKENSKTHLELEQLMEFESRYSRIIALGYEENSLVIEEKPKGKRGRSKKAKARNLLERLDKYRQETLNFMYDFRIPFDNNQAERDIRMTKVQ